MSVAHVLLTRIVWPTILLLVAASAFSAESKTAPSPQRVLFVGNSYLYYNDSLHNHVRRLVAAADPALGESLQYKSATIGGAPLAHHDIRHLLAPGHLGMKQAFDVVVLQDNSTSALSERARASFREKATEFDAAIRKHGARTALYMTHAHVKPSKYASPDMIRKVEDMYVSVGNEIGAWVIPVGLAFERAYRLKPDIQLHQDYDGSHPSLAGTYLAACVVYASLYGKSPVGNSYDYYGRVDKATAAFLQKVAAETVDAFKTR
jgi:hypothetical protein